MEKSYKTSIIIPGIWQNRDSFVEIVVKTFKYIFAGMFIGEIKQKKYYTAYFDDNFSLVQKYLEQFPEFVNEAGGVVQEKSLFILEPEIKSIKDLTDIYNLIYTLLEIGGSGVEIARAKKAITCQSLQNHNKDDLLKIFASIEEIKNVGIKTIGMGHFLKPDVFVRLILDEDSINLLMRCANYLISPKKEIVSGHTFSLGNNHPCFEILQKEDEFSDKNSNYYNPFGVIELIPLKKC